MTDTPKKFARLDETTHGQLLQYLRCGDEGPCITVMLPEWNGIEVGMTANFPDTDAGWDAAEQSLFNNDAQSVADAIMAQIDGNSQ